MALHFGVGPFLCLQFHSMICRVRAVGVSATSLYILMRVSQATLVYNLGIVSVNHFVTMRPCQAEPLYELAVYHRNTNHFAEAYGYAKQASLIPFPDDVLFVNKDIYSWKI